jgi:sugar phosphate isomerase/epimerase
MMLARLKLALEICAYMKVDTITIHLGNNHFEPATGIADEIHIGRMKESLSELLPLAEKLNITICIENIWFNSNSPQALLDIKKEFPTEYLGFCYDAGHAHLTEYGEADPEKSVVPYFWNLINMPVYWEKDIIGTFKKWVVNCHFHSNDGWNDQHLLPDPGNDTMPWDHIMEVLADAPRLQSVQSEVSVPQDLSITPAMLRNAFSRISPLLDA